MAKAQNDLFTEKLYKSFDMTLGDIRKFINKFHSEMKNGLTSNKSSLKMLPTFVDSAKGTEKGKYIALDLGGTNFRVLQVRLNGKSQSKVEHMKKFVIPKAVMRGTGIQLFNFIAQSIKKFLQINKISLTGERNMGFTFSFPVAQDKIDSGTLINWTKGFTASDVVGVNVVGLLTKALKRYGIENVKVTALANDAVGTLAAKSYEDGDCDVGIIFGTGTNACYRERASNIFSLKNQRSKNMIVNIEWGNFNKIPSNAYDKRLDKATINPGKQRMEKMISGLYLGELMRLVIDALIKHKLIFKKGRGKIAKGAFNTKQMSVVELDSSEDLGRIKSFLESVGIANSSFEERELFKRVCRLISRRAARIGAAAISAVVTWMDPQLKHNHTVAIDGSLYERYPDFRRTILATLEDIHREDTWKIRVVRAHDGSGVGVAIVAAVAASKK